MSSNNNINPTNGLTNAKPDIIDLSNADDGDKKPAALQSKQQPNQTPTIMSSNNNINPTNGLTNAKPDIIDLSNADDGDKKPAALPKRKAPDLGECRRCRCRCHC